ncbi:hypothetical protein PV677_36480 [Streptomyces sp. DE06-01C]|uniref:hypothetical protein n=1 Tax=Streptomyces sp. DE06-01C TaxID=3028656 RepID=UPI0029C2CDA9|nr:hypothetical protein [Streptomyces sp. DE06-01C]MDX5526169.1 hypothetical protein [Streptomyces sp. DE06-01C]
MTTDPDAPPTTVLPYGPGNRWTFQARGTSYTQTAELALLPEIDGSSITDEYVPADITALELWAMWVGKYADYQHEQHPDDYDPGEVRINWTVTTLKVGGVFELAPYSYDTRATRTSPYMPRENFGTVYTPPVHVVTGEPLNWLRLPVLDRGWNETVANKGGFIQELTGWKPSPLQPTVDVRQIGAAAGLYVPPL